MGSDCLMGKISVWGAEKGPRDGWRLWLHSNTNVLIVHY